MGCAGPCEQNLPHHGRCGCARCVCVQVVLVSDTYLYTFNRFSDDHKDARKKLSSANTKYMWRNCVCTASGVGVVLLVVLGSKAEYILPRTLLCALEVALLVVHATLQVQSGLCHELVCLFPQHPLSTILAAVARPCSIVRASLHAMSGRSRNVQCTFVERSLVFKRTCALVG